MRLVNILVLVTDFQDFFVQSIQKVFLLRPILKFELEPQQTEGCPLQLVLFYNLSSFFVRKKWWKCLQMKGSNRFYYFPENKIFFEANWVLCGQKIYQTKLLKHAVYLQKLFNTQMHHLEWTDLHPKQIFKSRQTIFN